jgi:trimeric autotransporter adhesin
MQRHSRVSHHQAANFQPSTPATAHEMSRITRSTAASIQQQQQQAMSFTRRKSPYSLRAIPAPGSGPSATELQVRAALQSPAASVAAAATKTSPRASSSTATSTSSHRGAQAPRSAVGSKRSAAVAGTSMSSSGAYSSSTSEQRSGNSSTLYEHASKKQRTIAAPHDTRNGHQRLQQFRSSSSSSDRSASAASATSGAGATTTSPPQAAPATSQHSSSQHSSSQHSSSPVHDAAGSSTRFRVMKPSTSSGSTTAISSSSTTSSSQQAVAGGSQQHASSGAQSTSSSSQKFMRQHSSSGSQQSMLPPTSPPRSVPNTAQQRSTHFDKPAAFSARTPSPSASPSPTHSQQSHAVTPLYSSSPRRDHASCAPHNHHQQQQQQQQQPRSSQPSGTLYRGNSQLSACSPPQHARPQATATLDLAVSPPPAMQEDAVEKPVLVHTSNNQAAATTATTYQAEAPPTIAQNADEQQQTAAAAAAAASEMHTSRTDDDDVLVAVLQAAELQHQLIVGMPANSAGADQQLPLSTAVETATARDGSDSQDSTTPSSNGTSSPITSSTTARDAAVAGLEQPISSVKRALVFDSSATDSVAVADSACTSSPLRHIATSSELLATDTTTAIGQRPEHHTLAHHLPQLVVTSPMSTPPTSQPQQPQPHSDTGSEVDRMTSQGEIAYLRAQLAQVCQIITELTYARGHNADQDATFLLQTVWLCIIRYSKSRIV